MRCTVVVIIAYQLLPTGETVGTQIERFSGFDEIVRYLRELAWEEKAEGWVLPGEGSGRGGDFPQKWPKGLHGW